MYKSTYLSQYFQDRLRPGRMLLVDTVEGKIEEDQDFKERICAARQYKHLTHNRVYLDQLRRDDVVSKSNIY